MDRRQFLKAAAAASAVTVLPLGRTAWAARVNETDYPRHRLIVVFLRGAVDGLSVVAPYHESAYYDLRPSIALPATAGADGLLDLDGRFGLHPALAGLEPLWRERSLAFVHACGSPDATRSHFDAQNYMESGTPGIKSTPDGWMNRLLAALPGAHAPTQAVGFGSTLPRILSGPVPVANIGVGKYAGRPLPLDRPAISEYFDRMYQGRDALSRAYREGQSARRQLMADLAEDMEGASQGAPPADNFTRIAEQIARLMVRDRGVQLAFVSLGGWDTHVNQGAATGALANRLRPLGEGLAALARGLGASYRDSTIVVLSEFGRTVRENGNGGTDHGHGNVLWLLGGGLNGGRVHGSWPGLSPEDLYEGRDLAVTTDFRAVIGAVLHKRLGLDRAALGKVFPDFSVEHLMVEVD